jgi:hypothetical protein
VKVGSLGPRPRNWYARSDQLALVARDRLTLRVPPDDLIDEIED